MFSSLISQNARWFVLLFLVAGSAGVLVPCNCAAQQPFERLRRGIEEIRPRGTILKRLAGEGAEGEKQDPPRLFPNLQLFPRDGADSTSNRERQPTPAGNNADREAEWRRAIAAQRERLLQQQRDVLERLQQGLRPDEDRSGEQSSLLDDLFDNARPGNSPGGTLGDTGGRDQGAMSSQQYLRQPLPPRAGTPNSNSRTTPSGNVGDRRAPSPQPPASLFQDRNRRANEPTLAPAPAADQGQVPTYIGDGPATRGENKRLGVRLNQFGPADNPKGLTIEAIQRGGTAAGSELQRGDVVLSIGGIDTRFPQDVDGIVEILRDGDQIEFEVLREGKKRKVMVQFGEVPSAPALESSSPPASEPLDGDALDFDFPG